MAMMNCRWCGEECKDEFCTGTTCRYESMKFRKERERKARREWIGEIKTNKEHR